MCGIAGKLHWEGGYITGSVKNMSDALAHRGPDDQGILELQDIALGHRRLSIIDLSPGAKQPMTDAEKKYWIVYNGEVYNFQEMRSELEKSGYRFITRSDTEVIINAYDKWGAKCLEKFNGMFAFAIWDIRKKELFLARDRFGKKPLYYSFLKNKGLVFASELGALIKDEQVRGALAYSPEALNCYLALGYILSPLSMYENIFKLEPGHFIHITEKGEKVKNERYFSYADCFRKKVNHSLPEMKETINGLLEEAVRLRMISDVPVGAFLSGGVDSSSVVNKMRKLHNGEIHTFSIGFEEESYNELQDADFVAGILKTQHHGKTVSADEMKTGMLSGINAFDEPFADNSLIPMMEVSRLASEKVKVVLSGDGADEIFAGYVTYKADEYYKTSRLIPRAVRNALLNLAGSWDMDANEKIGLRYKAKQFLHGSLKSPEEAHYSWRLIFHPEERVNILGEKYRSLVYDTDPLIRFIKFYNEVPELDRLDRHLFVDAMTWLPDDILVKTDRTTMHVGLESRSPYLDINLVSYAASLPVHVKMRGLQIKYILKKSLEGILPERILHKKKSGFNAPVGKWIGISEGDEFRSFNKFVFNHKIKNAAAKAKGMA